MIELTRPIRSAFRAGQVRTIRKPKGLAGHTKKDRELNMKKTAIVAVTTILLAATSAYAIDIGVSIADVNVDILTFM